MLKAFLCLLLLIVILTALSQQALGRRAAARTLKNSRSLPPSFLTLCSFRIQLDLEACDNEIEAQALLCLSLIQTNVCDLCWERAPLPS